MDPLFYLLIGLLLGLAAGWLAASVRKQNAPPDDRLTAELRRQLTDREAELELTRNHLSEAKTAVATARANQAAAEKLLAEQGALHEKARAGAEAAQEKALASLREAFKALSAEALSQTQPQFLRLANETLSKFQESARGDLAQRQQAIATLLEPLRQQLETYQNRLQQSETARSTALGEVRRQLETLGQQSQSLSTETLQLRRVLSSSQARGRWGEETLRRVVEAAGMSPHCDFSEQLQADEGKPDLVVHLPGDRVIIVDAKVPELDFLTATDTGDEPKRAESLAAHAAKLKSTIKALADRDYPSQFPSALDYVVLFLPAESLFSAALEGDRDLMLWAQNKRIILATPSSLIAILRSVSVSWQQHSQTQNARAIAEAAQELFLRICRFTEHLEGIRDGLETANDAFNAAVGSYERMVRPSGEKLLRLSGGAAGKELAEVNPVQATLRLPPAGS